ncbi:MAG: ATP-dependent zinc metalloprotease FtsH [Sebaldella sp.]|nr:ATP-dependent zinc metalloprotease FtsH [Sebaldella sp.]
MQNNNDKKDDISKRLEELKKQRKNQNNGGNNNNQKPPFNKFPIILGVIMLFLLLTALPGLTDKLDASMQNRKEVEYTDFVNKVKTGVIKEVGEKDEFIVGKVKEGDKEITYKTRKITERVGDDPNLMGVINESNAKLNVQQPTAPSLFWPILINFLPVILIIGAFVYLSKKMSNGQGGPGQIFNFGKTKTNKNENLSKVKFDDVAGVDEAKEELKEIVEFLKNPEKFTKAGARVPKGVLLLGRPGTGKTLLAKAVAGESGASFFSISGSEFVEMFVGVGASRVRDLFEKAKKSKPAIIFIDEIDAVGRKRGNGKHGGNDEREQTLNQLLVEMDGFETDEKIIVVAATNREDVLDPALLRAGRFDRRISVDAPDVQGRIAILEVHAKNKKLAPDVELGDIAKITPGFVGADLENLLNEAAILAAREGRDTIKMLDLDEAVDKIGMGLGQKSKIIRPEEKRLLAYHEAGHAVVSELTPEADPVHKVTIIPRGSAGGFMMPLPEEKLVTGSKKIIADIRVSFGGRAAEELVLDDISTGAYSDIRHVTGLAKAYVTKVGMNATIGPINLEPQDGEFILSSGMSDETAREVDLEIRGLLKREYKNTLDLLRDNRDKLDGVAELLLKKETITGNEVRAIISGKPLEEVEAVDKKEDTVSKLLEEEAKVEEEVIKDEKLFEQGENS